MSGTASRDPASKGWLIAILLTVLCVLPVLNMALSQYTDRGSNVEAVCLISQQPDGVSDDEVPLESSAITWMPAGRRCVFEAADGGTIAVQTGWPATLVGLASTILGIGATVSAMRRRPENRTHVALFPAFVILVIWLIVIFSAHTVTSSP